MRIGIDAHALGTGLAGNETYIKNLVPALAEIDRQTQYVVFVTKGEETWQEQFPNVRIHRIWPHTRAVRIPVSLPLAALRTGIDLLHVQYTAPPVSVVPVVTTIHDISFEHLPQFYTPRQRWFFKLAIGYTARHAARILTDSEYSRRDIIQTYDLPEDRVVVTPLGVSSNFRPIREGERIEAVKRKYGITRDYLLSVGSLQPRKNLVRLISAYVELRSREDDFAPQLVIVGKRAWLYQDIFRAARASGYLSDILFTDFVPDDDLAVLYSGATVFIYPSVFEGFGLPVLEAMACGTPVITSNSSSLPEVAGDAAILVDPYDELALAKAILRLTSDARLRERLSLQGLRQVQNFSWQKTAALTHHVYEEVVRRAKGKSPPLRARSAAS